MQHVQVHVLVQRIKKNPMKKPHSLLISIDIDSNHTMTKELSHLGRKNYICMYAVLYMTGFGRRGCVP